MDLPESSRTRQAYPGAMRSVPVAQIIHASYTQPSSPHTAGWLRWYILGAVILVALLAWACLRGYSKGSDDQQQK